MYLVFDTETNGKILDRRAPVEQVEMYPRISQLSYMIFDENRNLIKNYNNFIYPDGWEFPDEEFFRLHADINKNRELGIPIVDALNEFVFDALQCKVRIAHNMTFDSRIIRAEMFRAGITQEFESLKVCTMSNARVTAFCALPKPSGGYGKWPKLEELHQKLFNCDFEGAHNSSSDVAATAKCFFELLDRNIISLEPKEKPQPKVQVNDL